MSKYFILNNFLDKYDLDIKGSLILTSWNKISKLRRSRDIFSNDLTVKIRKIEQMLAGLDVSNVKPFSMMEGREKRKKEAEKEIKLIRTLFTKHTP